MRTDAYIVQGGVFPQFAVAEMGAICMLEPMRLLDPLLWLLVFGGCSTQLGPQGSGSLHPHQVRLEPSIAEIQELEHRFASAKVIRTYSGKATYYSRSLEGHKMASGERYDPNRAQAAHRTLPFGTIVRVTNRKSDASVVVRITDRGPYVKGRIIDLSYAAAARIGLIQAGVADIRLEVLETPQ